MPKAMPYILVVDDDPDTQEVVSRYLSRAGYNVRTAGNGREALHQVTSQLPDLIILDAMMPEMDGVRFLEVMRSYLRWQTMPVILLTAYEQGPHINNASALDVRRIFYKAHFELSDLLAAVKEATGGAARIYEHSQDSAAAPQ